MASGLLVILVHNSWRGLNTHSILMMFFFQAEDGIRDLVRSRGLGDVYKRQHRAKPATLTQVQHHDMCAKRLEQAEKVRTDDDCLSLIHI